MPRLLLFAPCEKVILSGDDNTISLISVLQEIYVFVPKDLQLPADALMALKWYGFAMWQIESSELEKQFEQYMQLFLPDGTPWQPQNLLLVQPIPTDKPSHRVINRFDQFPIFQFGEFTLRVFYRVVGDSDWIEVGSFPLTLRQQDTPPRAVVRSVYEPHFTNK